MSPMALSSALTLVMRSAAEVAISAQPPSVPSFAPQTKSFSAETVVSLRERLGKRGMGNLQSGMGAEWRVRGTVASHSSRRPGAGRKIAEGCMAGLDGLLS